MNQNWRETEQRLEVRAGQHTHGNQNKRKHMSKHKHRAHGTKKRNLPPRWLTVKVLSGTLTEKGRENVTSVIMSVEGPFMFTQLCAKYSFN